MDAEEVEATLAEFGAQISALKFVTEVVLANALGGVDRDTGEAFIARLLDLSKRTNRYPTNLEDARAVELSDHAIRVQAIVEGLATAARERAGWAGQAPGHDRR